MTSLSIATELPTLGIDLGEKEEIWDVVRRRANLSRDIIPIRFRNMKNWFKMHNAIQWRCYKSHFPAVQAATSSVLSDTKRMRSEASVVSGEEKAAFKRHVKEEKWWRTGLEVFAESRFVRSISCNRKMRSSPIILPEAAYLNNWRNQIRTN